jgi:hypothetical protein
MTSKYTFVIQAATQKGQNNLIEILLYRRKGTNSAAITISARFIT